MFPAENIGIGQIECLILAGGFGHHPGNPLCQKFDGGHLRDAFERTCISGEIKCRPQFTANGRVGSQGTDDVAWDFRRIMKQGVWP